MAVKLREVSQQDNDDNENRVYPIPPILPPIATKCFMISFAIIIVVIVAAGIWVLSSSVKSPEQYTKDITIKAVDYGDRNEPFYIISTEGISYPTRSSQIYDRAKDLIGTDVTIIYIPDDNHGSDVISIKAKHNLCVIVPGVGCKES